MLKSTQKPLLSDSAPLWNVLPLSFFMAIVYPSPTHCFLASKQLFMSFDSLLLLKIVFDPDNAGLKAIVGACLGQLERDTLSNLNSIYKISLENLRNDVSVFSKNQKYKSKNLRAMESIPKVKDCYLQAGHVGVVLVYKSEVALWPKPCLVALRTLC